MKVTPRDAALAIKCRACGSEISRLVSKPGDKDQVFACSCGRMKRVVRTSVAPATAKPSG